MDERRILLLTLVVLLISGVLQAQPYGEPDRGEPGDVMIQGYLRRESERLHGGFLEGIASAEDWRGRLARYREEYFHMLGLWPPPERTPLEATVTSTLARDGFVVENLHYQSRPGLYVTSNLYRPAEIPQGERLPAVLYVCGHASRGRNGNKTAYQSHGIWLARHGYVCLITDTLQLGEIAAVHHGTYLEKRWWWHSRGYTPGGVECWNGMRGIDYLTSRDDVDPDRIAVTGISGGGAATFWVAAADERVKVAVSVSGMADLPSYVANRVINGHCDCMFLYNTFQWPWARIAGLVAPRPLLFSNSNLDAIFPMDANERVINRLEHLYSRFGAGDLVDSVVSVGGHAYRKDLRQSAYRFINTHLKSDARIVTDSEVDLVTGPRDQRHHPIPPERLRVFPRDADIPQDELNTTIDRHFVPLAEVVVPPPEEYEAWRKELLSELRRVTFRSLPERVPPAQLAGADEAGAEIERLETDEGVVVPLRRVTPPVAEVPRRIVLVVANLETLETFPGRESIGTEDRVYRLEPRGIGSTRWTRKNPPNYVERSHLLLGSTVDTGRVRDVIAAARYLRSRFGDDGRLYLMGKGRAAVIAAYAALWEPEVDGVILHTPPLSHMDPLAPQFLNVLRLGDVPEILGMLAPRDLIIPDFDDPRLDKTAALYEAAGAKGKFDRLRRAPSAGSEETKE